MAELQGGEATDGSQNYTYQCVPGIDANGDSNTSVTFLVNTNNAEQDPPYYFLCGSTANHLILYSFTPTTDPSDLGSDCVTQISTLITLDTPVASVVFYPTTQILYVAGLNGDLSLWSVVFDSDTGVPSVQSIASNNEYDAAPNSQIQLSLLNDGGGSPYAIATGLCKSERNALVYFNANLDEVGFLVGTPSDTVAIAAAPNGVYAATASSLLFYAASQIDLSSGLLLAFSGEWVTIQNAPDGATLTSLAYLPMTSGGAYPQGVLLAGGYSQSDSNDSDDGVVFAYDIATGGCESLETQISGPVYGIMADDATHAMYCNGSNGLGFLNLNPGEGGTVDTALVPNTPDASNAKGVLGRILEDILFATVIVATTAVGEPEVGVEVVELDVAADGAADGAGEAAGEAADPDALAQQQADQAIPDDGTPTANAPDEPANETPTAGA